MALTVEAKKRWNTGDLPLHAGGDVPRPPEHPARPHHLLTIASEDMPRRAGHDLESRLMLIHSFCHIESYAIDLSWDMLCRFADMKLPGPPSFEEGGVQFWWPREFFTDWVRIAGEESGHFGLWAKRLQGLGSYYGARAVHDGLWQSASATANNPLARLAVVHAVHEARGLDVAPKLVAQLQSSGDAQSAKLLQIIERDEKTHVRSGLTWFKYICDHSDPPLDPVSTFHAEVRSNFTGNLKPPFAKEARASCGFTEEWYLPLAGKPKEPKEAKEPKEKKEKRERMGKKDKTEAKVVEPEDPSQAEELPEYGFVH